MKDTTVAIFQHSLQTTDEWLTDLMHELGWTSRHKAYSALRATLHALRSNMPVDECAQLSAQLPLLVRGVYWEGWDPACGTPRSRHEADFLTAIRNEFPNDPDADPSVIAHAVFKVMAKHVAAGEIEDVRGLLPANVRRLVPAA